MMYWMERHFSETWRVMKRSVAEWNDQASNGEFKVKEFDRSQRLVFVEAFSRSSLIYSSNVGANHSFHFSSINLRAKSVTKAIVFLPEDRDTDRGTVSDIATVARAFIMKYF